MHDFDYFPGEQTDVDFRYANEWLFLVDDGKDDLVASWEQGSAIKAAHVPKDTVEFPDPEGNAHKDIVEAAYCRTFGDAYDGVSDHWHIFVKSTGWHWIAFSLTDTNEKGLQFGKGLAVVRFKHDLTTIDGPYLISEAEKDDFAGETNDLILVEWSDGIAIGLLRQENTGLRVFLISDDDPGSVVDVVDVFPGASDAHFSNFANGGSATYEASRGLWSFLCPDGLVPSSYSWVRQSWVDLNTNAGLTGRGEEDRVVSTDAVVVIPIDGNTSYNYAMPMVAELTDGFKALVVRRVLVEDKKTDDNGAIYLYILNEYYEVIAGKELIVESGGNRPHIIAIPSEESSLSFRIIITWDTTDGGQQYCKITELEVELERTEFVAPDTNDFPGSDFRNEKIRWYQEDPPPWMHVGDHLGGLPEEPKQWDLTTVPAALTYPKFWPRVWIRRVPLPRMPPRPWPVNAYGPVLVPERIDTTNVIQQVDPTRLVRHYRQG